MTAGLDAAEALEPGHGTAELWASMDDTRKLVLHADAQARLNRAMSVFASGSAIGSRDWQVAAGLRARW